MEQPSAYFGTKGYALLQFLVALGTPLSGTGQPTAPPTILLSASIQSQAVNLGDSTSFAVSATGQSPLTFQWQFNRINLVGKTNRTLSITSAGAAVEGDYSVIVANTFGSVTSAPMRLWVVPPGNEFVKGNFTNTSGLRLPYFCFFPTNYSTGRSYPLMCWFHGTPGDETVITTPNYGYPGYANYPPLKTMASYRQQATDPVILFWPTRRAGDTAWTDAYLQLVSSTLARLLQQFNIDTNRIYVGGYSEGLHAAWDLVAMRPGFFAAGCLSAGVQGQATASSMKDTPFWVWCARDDADVGTTRSAVLALRQAGAPALYTEYAHGGHYGYPGSPGGVDTGASTPVIVDWLLAQRRGLPLAVEPLLSVTSPEEATNLITASTVLDLAGTAQALDESVGQVVWTNYLNKTGGVAQGTNLWSAQAIPLMADKTNTILLSATTTSWSPALGGSTSFASTLSVFSSPIRVSLAVQGSVNSLSWIGGAPPYQVQRTYELTGNAWETIVTNALSPWLLDRPFQPDVFYRVLGR